MEVPKEIRDYMDKVKDLKERAYYLRAGVDELKRLDPAMAGLQDNFFQLEMSLLRSYEAAGEALAKLYEIDNAIYTMKTYTKDFDLCSGDWIRITLFSGEWFEGTVITAHWYRIEGWYIEIDKRKGSSVYMEPGYGYWKQDMDGGTVEKIENSFSQQM